MSGTVWMVLAVIILALAAVAAAYFYRNMHYDRKIPALIRKAHFSEKQVCLPDGTRLNYGEGPDNGPPLFLIHGQAVSWEDYAPVLPALSERFHLFAVDCHGHGGSSKDPAKYTARAMGQDFQWFLENVIGAPAFVSGLSSGGLLTMWLAANAPGLVRGAVLEDPPIFSTEMSRYSTSFAWLDNFQTIHGFLRQTGETCYIRYYLTHCYMRKLVGKGWERVARYAFKYLDKHPGKPLRIFYMPPSANRLFDLMNKDYDLRFGDTFYDDSWFDGYDREKILSAFRCPSILIHTNWRVSDDGVLMAAMSGEDARRAHELIPGNVLAKVNSGHDFHAEKPKEFIRLMTDFAEKVESGSQA